MKITTIQISGFRKILKATINMEDDITVIAGANNSGKTSIVELFNYVFNAKGALCSDDFPVYESQEWCTAVFPYFQAQFKQENKKDDLIANILGTIVPSENPENEMLLTPIEVLIQVDVLSHSLMPSKNLIPYRFQSVESYRPLPRHPAQPSLS